MPKLPVEASLERGLFASRWLLAPIYVGLVVALGMLVVVFLRELIYYAARILTLSADEVILAALTLIDLSLVGNLLLIVLFSGYETFVSRLDLQEDAARPEWMGTVDFAGLKMKLVASIVAISGIHLLKRFMEIGKANPNAPFDEAQLRWLVIIHLTFVFSGVLLALMDWLGARSRK